MENSFGAFIKYQIIDRGNGKFSIKPIERIFDHEIFRELFVNNGEVVVYEVDALDGGKETQYIFSVPKKGGKRVSLILCRPSNENKGWGKLPPKYDDMILFGFSEPNTFEVYVLIGDRDDYLKLYKKYISGDLDNEIRVYREMWPKYRDTGIIQLMPEKLLESVKIKKQWHHYNINQKTFNNLLKK